MGIFSMGLFLCPLRSRVYVVSLHRKIVKLKMENMNNYIELILTALTSGSLGWLFTLKYTRQGAKAEATEKVQQVYDKMIEDLMKEREQMKSDRQEAMNDKKELEKRLDRAELEIQQNTRVVRSMQPFLCSVMDCKLRQSMTLANLKADADNSQNQK